MRALLLLILLALAACGPDPSAPESGGETLPEMNPGTDVRPSGDLTPDAGLAPDGGASPGGTTAPDADSPAFLARAAETALLASPRVDRATVTLDGDAVAMDVTARVDAADAQTRADELLRIAVGDMERDATPPPGPLGPTRYAYRLVLRDGAGVVRATAVKAADAGRVSFEPLPTGATGDARPDA